LGQSSAQIIAPLQIALMPAVSPIAILPSAPAPRVENETAPPLLASPLSLLCTLLI
jgi:hypothetical protein